MSIGDRIKEARKARGLTQEDLRALAKISQSVISDLENNVHAGTTRLARIAEVLKVSALWLETGRGERDLTETEEPSDFVSLEWIRRDEMELLNYFRGTDSDGRQAMLSHAQSMPVIIKRPSAANDE